jgi:hypothetical protein
MTYFVALEERHARYPTASLALVNSFVDRKEECMGVEYVHYLIPEDNTYKPRPEDLSRLVNALVDSGFVIKTGADTFTRETINTFGDDDPAVLTGCYVHLGEGEYSPFLCPCSARDIAAWGERDYRIVWTVDSINELELKYPLNPFPEWGDAYYELQLHVAKEFVYHTSESIDPFDRVHCECGRSLEPGYDFSPWFDGPPVFRDRRIPRNCLSCGRPFRPQELVAQVRDLRTGVPIDRPGGATYLFAVVIDCGKGFAREGCPIQSSKEFLALVEKSFGRKFYQLGDIY